MNDVSRSESRREFLKRSAVWGSVLVVPASVLGKGGAKPPSERLNIACLGVGGMGQHDVRAVSSENLVAFCDVDDARAAPSYKAFPKVPRFKDYRRLFDKFGDKIDAVTVSTPDHVHYQVARLAVELGKGVYVQKPLCQTVRQVRDLVELAGRKGVATQMGNQGHSHEATRLVWEWVRAGVIGPVREVKCWTNRPVWPQGMTSLPPRAPVPPTLDWKLWLAGVADYPYNPAYAPFRWRGWYAFGCGALGDMACHIMDPAFFALDLRAPVTVRAEVTGRSPVAFPKKSIVTYEFPARGDMPPVKLIWYDGGEMPERPPELEPGRRMGNSMGGSLLIGDKATIMTDSHCGRCRIIPEKKMVELRPSLPPKSLPRVRGGHHQDWIRACKGLQPKACSNFDYAGPLTEVVLLGVIAQRLPGRTLEWDARAGRFKNDEEANRLLSDPAPHLPV